MQRKRKWLLVGGGLIVAVITSCSLALVPIKPAGKFREDKIGFTGVSYYEFKDGRVHLVLSGASTQDCGHYAKAHGRWIWVTKDGSTNLIQSTLLAVRITTPDKTWSKRFPRVFIDP